MDKMFYTILVEKDRTSQIESLLNRHCVSLGDWDKTKAFDYFGMKYVNYTILCTSSIYESIMKIMYES